MIINHEILKIELFFTANSETDSSTVKVYTLESETPRFIFLILALKDYVSLIQKKKGFLNQISKNIGYSIKYFEVKDN